MDAPEWYKKVPPSEWSVLVPYVRQELNMFSKIVALVAFVAYAQAIDLGHASSYSSVSNHLVHAAPVAHVAPVAHYSHVAPVAHYSHVAPVAHYSHVAPVAHVVKAVHHEEYADAHPHYSFEYGVQDAHTHDIKNQHEERDGDVVKGHYSLLQPDGTTRTVHYSADHHNGFNAQVEYSGHAAHPQAVHKAVVAIPAYHH